MESFTLPAAGGIIEQTRDDGMVYVLIQERWKEEAPNESGLLEIPAGKIRAFESVFDCLRREVREETGLRVVKIWGETEASWTEINGYRVINYAPFACAQNVEGHYPIMVQVFICEVQGEALRVSDESQNLQWVALAELQQKLATQPEKFYPMHVKTLEQYLKYREIYFRR
ncbi:MAG TPA: NUDIX domain-containing protein [Bacillota bacterium]|nr:NUDIX domain-containing protein [Bacillota bacterium]